MQKQFDTQTKKHSTKCSVVAIFQLYMQKASNEIYAQFVHRVEKDNSLRIVVCVLEKQKQDTKQKENKLTKNVTTTYLLFSLKII